MILLWMVPAALCVFALERRRRARRTRAQTVTALGLVPELAGTVPPGTADRAAAVAAVLGPRMGADPGVAARAARLYGVAPEVITDSGISPAIAALVRDAANAQSGEATGAAAAVRVAHEFARRTGENASQTSGALFRTLVEHAAGDERRAAEALVHLVQGGAVSV